MMKHITLLALIFCLSVTTYSCAQSKMTQKEKFQSTYNGLKNLVLTKEYKFVGEVVYSNKNREQLDGANNYIDINMNNVSLNLNKLMSKDQLRMSGIITDYDTVFNDEKQTISIQFKLDSKAFYMDIKPNGNAFLTVKSGVSAISQVGSIKRL